MQFCAHTDASKATDTNLETYFAHTSERADWEPLDKHLAEVGKLAASFAGAFGASAWGEAVGQCHDLGKYSREFQDYLRRSSDPDSGAETAPGRVDHSTFGARFAAEAFGSHAGQILAFCIAGHHAGLANAVAEEDSEQRSTLQYRLDPRKPIPEVRAFNRPNSSQLRLPFSPTTSNPGFELAFFARMLFSCLIDADRLATEAFCSPEAASERSLPRPSLSQLADIFYPFMANKQSEAAATVVNHVRASVLSDCTQAATLDPGFFSLHVPTGGGKTYASLAFALRHAENHGLRRVVAAVPFTSITEQTADAYRAALGPLALSGLIEHHSSINPVRETRANQLGTENWDAPLVVTTNVQLFESLFASATTPCRKLHRLARSVIILDEAQTLPVELLAPALAALRELVAHYGTTVVLCTATQPALDRSSDFRCGIENVRSIVRNPQQHFASLKRVTVHRLGHLTDDDLAGKLAAERSALCIVNTRSHAASIFQKLCIASARGGELFHLSTWMCAQHRRETLASIRQRLAAQLPCIVVSTQLVEAGVDLDFAAVYRAEAGFDSIAQAAGRCNREGHLPTGRVYLFESDARPPLGLLRHAADTAKELAAKFPNPLAPEAVHEYFRLLYWTQQHHLDARQILDCFRASAREPILTLQFRTASERFRMIRDAQVPILISFDRCAEKLHRLLLRDVLDHLPERALQPYLVPVHSRAAQSLLDAGATVGHSSGIALLVNDQLYSADRGLLISTAGIEQPFLEA